MFLGLCDKKMHAFHPDHITRVDLNTIAWVWSYDKKSRSAVMRNSEPITFKVLRGPIPPGDNFLCIFEDCLDSEPLFQGAAIFLKLSPATGDTIQCRSCQFQIANDFAKTMRRNFSG